MDPTTDVVMPSGFRRDDLVRLMTQCLTTLGYANSAEALQRESGILLLAEPVAQFRAAVLDGKWETAESLLDSLQFSTAASRLSAEWLLVHQKYLELIVASKHEEALRVLRSQLTPLDQRRAAGGCSGDASSVGSGGAGAVTVMFASDGRMRVGGHQSAHAAHGPANGSAQPAANGASGANGACSSSPSPPGGTLGEATAYLMCTSSDLHERLGWDGGSVMRARESMLEALQKLIPPSVLLPEHRLQALLQQAVMWQSAQYAPAVAPPVHLDASPYLPHISRAPLRASPEMPPFLLMVSTLHPQVCGPTIVATRRLPRLTRGFCVRPRRPPERFPQYPAGAQ